MKKQNRKSGPLICLFALIFSNPALAQGPESLADLPSFRKGCADLETGKYKSGAVALRKCWEIISQGDADSTGKNLVIARLLECWVRGGESDRAVRWYHLNDDRLRFDVTSKFWATLALQNEEHFSEAARHYSTLVKEIPQPSHALISNYAWCLFRGGNPKAGLEILDGAFSPQNDEDRIARARMAFEADQLPRSGELVDAVLPRLDQLPPLWEFQARDLRAQLLSKATHRDEAVSEILEWIPTLKKPDQIYRACSLLREIALPINFKKINSRLDQWRNTESNPKDLKIAAEYTQLILAAPGDSERLKAFIRKHPGHPLAREARLALMQLEPGKDFTVPGDPTKPAPIDPVWDARLHFLKATQLYWKKQWKEAAEEFEISGAREKGAERQRAIYNAAVAALQSGDQDLFTTLRDQLIQFDKDASIIGDLLYKTGLYYASRGDNRAFQALNSFILKFPNHPSRIEAELAIAEIHLNQVPPRPQSARAIFKRILQRPLTLYQNERLDYIAVWTESVANNTPSLISHAVKFLADWPHSDFRDEVSMLLGTAYYQSDQMHLAETVFRKLVVDNSQSEFAGAARFFAAKSTPPGDDALQEWSEIIQENGPLAQAARHEKGLLLLAMDRYGASRELFNQVIEKEDIQSELRYAAKSDLGFAWYMEALAHDRDKVMLEMAADIFGQISSHPEASRAWRFQAAVRRGKCLEALGNIPVALEIYDSIVEDESEDGSLFFGSDSPIEENEWRYRAGFSAMEILESKGDWAGAIRVADALSAKNGPRAIEAARHADLLRLKHWIWE